MLLRKSSRRGILFWEADLLDDEGDWKVTAALFTSLPSFPGALVYIASV